MSPTTGRIAGAIGLVTLLGSVYTYLVVIAVPWFAGAQALVGAALIAVYFASNYSQLGQFASSRSSFFMVSAALMTVMVTGALVAVNYIAAKRDKSWDLTNKKIYSLAPQTVTTLQGLKDKVTAIGFMQTSHPAYDSLQNLFERYHREAPDKFEFSFKDPRKSPDLALKYQVKEGQATVVVLRGEGANESHTALNVVSEQELTNALIKINAVGEQKVYFVQGHGEWPLTESRDSPDSPGSVSELKKTLIQEGYAPETLTLMGKDVVPADAALLIIAGARDLFKTPELLTLQNYLDTGGRVLFFAEGQAEAGLGALLKVYSIEVDKGIVADDHFFVSSPYQVVSQFYGDHEITKLLKQLTLTVEFPLSRGFTVLREGSKATTTAIVLTSPYAWLETTPDENPQRSDGEKTGQIPLVVASTRPADPNAGKKRFDESRLAVFGNSQILVDQNWGHEANRNLVMNSVAWATQQVSKITIRPPDRDISTIDLDPLMIGKIRLVATDLFPLSLLSLGLAIWISRRSK